MEERKAHLFLPHFFSDKAATFFSEEFGGDHFDLLLLVNTQIKSNYSKDVNWTKVFCYKNAIECYKIMRFILRRYDRVYMHSSFLLVPVKLLLFLFSRKELKKLVWVEWGYDLYITSSNQFADRFNSFVKRVIRRMFDMNIPNFVGIHPVDCTYYKKVLKGNSNIYFAPYAFSKTHDSFLASYKKRSSEEKIKAGEPFVIQICHRPETDFKLIEVLDSLRAFKNENIQILIPRGYGDQKYADKVENYAISVFGKEKVRSLREFVPRDEYLRILDSTDVLLINSTRQVGLGSIHAMFYMQKKVFLPVKSFLTPFFNEQGIRIFNIEDLGNMTFNDLTRDEDLAAEREFIMKFNGMDSVQLWNNVFNSIN